ncbi:alpha/beta fold hydrolase [Actinophytocola sp.]|uniref:alpha/beta fold hydrolase n=1 Tax=Actinophytocola sp. TaxID=1872138 RepID=UPI003D6A6721
MNDPAPTSHHPRTIGEIIDVDGVRTHIGADIGTGQPVLLVHGSGPGNTGMMSWAPLLPRLPDYRLIVADLPGYGRSEPMAVPDEPANVARHLSRLCAALQVSDVAVVGHSRGARVAIELAAAFPDLVSRLVGFGAGSIAPDGHLALDGNGYTAQVSRLVGFGVTTDNSLANFMTVWRGEVYHPDRLDNEWLTASYEHFVHDGQMDRYLRRMSDSDVLTFYHRHNAAEFRERMRSIRQPCLMVFGREDANSPYQRALPLIDTIQDVEFHLFSKCGHFVQFDRPAELAGLIGSFLAR